MIAIIENIKDIAVKSYNLWFDNYYSYCVDEFPSAELLTKFYNEHYKPLTTNDAVIYYDKLNYVLAYEAIDIVKNIT